MSELRRRNVPRSVVAYWVVAWTCIEVSSVIEQALYLPEWVDQIVVILSVAGLLVVVILSWTFEWGPSGVVSDDGALRELAVTEHEREFARRVASEVYGRLSRDLGRCAINSTSDSDRFRSFTHGN